MPTFCNDCGNCMKENKSDPPWRWLCVKHPRLEGYGFVLQGTWINAPPYLHCKDVNGGACPLFERYVPGQMTMKIEAA